MFNVFDVGGTKSERKKWIHCFEHVNSVIFFASLSCYDEVLFENENINRMEDSIVLFEEICNNSWFTQTSMILFLNKKDIFAEKIKYVPITVCRAFIGFTNDNSLNIQSFDDTTDYIKEVFASKNHNEKKYVYTHLTCAADRMNVQKVFNDVQHIVMENSLMNRGLMGDLGNDE